MPAAQRQEPLCSDVRRWCELWYVNYKRENWIGFFGQKGQQSGVRTAKGICRDSHKGWHFAFSNALVYRVIQEQAHRQETTSRSPTRCTTCALWASSGWCKGKCGGCKQMILPESSLRLANIKVFAFKYINLLAPRSVGFFIRLYLLQTNGSKAHFINSQFLAICRLQYVKSWKCREGTIDEWTWANKTHLT